MTLSFCGRAHAIGFAIAIRRREAAVAARARGTAKFAADNENLIIAAQRQGDALDIEILPAPAPRALRRVPQPCAGCCSPVAIALAALPLGHGARASRSQRTPRRRPNPPQPATEDPSSAICAARKMVRRYRGCRLPPANDGEAGALAGIDDDNVTGEFLGQDFSLVARRLKPGEDAAHGFGANWPGRALNS